MKKLAALTNVLVLTLTVSSFAAPKPAPRPAEQVRIKNGSGTVTSGSGVSSQTTQTVNPGVTARTGTNPGNILNNSVSQAAASVARTQLLKGMCANIPGITAAQRAEVDFAAEKGLGTGDCLSKLSGNPEATSNGLKIITAGNIVFKREARDTNRDGKVDSNDLTDDIAAKMLAAQAKDLSAPLNKTPDEALQVLEQTSPNCALPSTSVGTPAAFAQASRLLN